MTSVTKITLGIIAALVIIIGVYAYVSRDTKIAVDTTTATSTDTVICTMDVKRCSDGSYVGRVGPNCEFALCSGESSTSSAGTDINVNGGVTYPADILK